MKHLAYAAVIAAAVPLAPAVAQQAAQHKNASAAPAARQEYKLGDLVIRQPWARATPKGAPVAGGYATITNTGKSADRLVGGTFTGAGKVEVHEMTVTGGIMKMRHLANGLEIGPGQTVTLKPGSFHLMFMKLKGGVAPGKPVKGSLQFAKAGKVDIVFAVGRIGSKSPPGMMHKH
ncbi:MAG: copper chaperone PCu(A)C [Hyphomicrobiales bacterium]|nr:copper chaperone PCu(A)C [Hyphomicrobiales bacterium]